jgi:hypothetical protein
MVLLGLVCHLARAVSLTLAVLACGWRLRSCLAISSHVCCVGVEGQAVVFVLFGQLEVGGLGLFTRVGQQRPWDDLVRSAVPAISSGSLI